MKILIAIGVRQQEEAGAASVALNHARELRKSGHNVECWFTEDVLSDPVRPKRLEPLFFAIAIARRILKNQDRFDVVNLHAPWGCVYGAWRLLFRRSSSPPYVMTMQGSEERFAQAMRGENRKGRAWNFAWKNRVWHRVFHQTMYNYSIRTADYGAVANREGWIMAELEHRREFGRIWFVPNGTEERFFIARGYKENGPLRLLYVGSWLDRKGVHYLADCFDLVAKAVAGTRLTIAGCLASEKEVKKYFPRQLHEQICVVPFVKRDEILAVYEEHDIFVFPSLVEGMPLTLLEAMATGLPVVTTNTSGMADVVEHEVDGLLAPAADAEGLTIAIERLCRSAALRKQLGLAAQEKMKRYTWKLVVAQLEGILRLAARTERS